MKIFMMLCAFLLCSALAAEVKLPDEMRFFAQDMERFLPDAAGVKQSGRGIYDVLDKNGNKIAKLYLERIADKDRVEGYGGTVEIAVLFGMDERVKGVLIGRNRESRGWLKRVRAAKFLEQWNHLRMVDIPDKRVDAVASATYTSKAVAAGVRKLAESYLAEEKASERKR